MIRPPSHTTILEKCGKVLRHFGIWVFDWLFHRRRPPAVIAWPDLPSRKSTLHHVCRENRWELTNVQRQNPLFIIRFEDHTYKSVRLPDWMNHENRVLNVQCNDISKSHLDAHHQEVFGYGVSIDPTTHKGLMLEKSEANAAHDGLERQGPIAQLTPGKVYQRIINNACREAEHYCDLRLVYALGQTPCLYIKQKTKEKRYTNETESAKLALPQTQLAPSELQLIGKLMQRLGVDMAELDLLRDRDDQKLYVVDVNPTPWGPPAGLSTRDRRRAIKLIAECHMNLFKPQTTSRS